MLVKLLNNPEESKRRFEQFKLIPKVKHGRKVCGVGVNDVEYATSYKREDGSTASCQIYQRWYSMLVRCYSNWYTKKHPTYVGATVCDEWLYFSNFRDWVLTQDWYGKNLDKDIVVSKNKVYSPDTCLFISQDINKLLTSRNNAQGKWPYGVTYNKKLGKFRAQGNTNGNRIALGCFNTSEEAHEAYIKFKSAYVREVALKQEPFLRSCLERIAGEIERGEYYV